MTAPRHANQAQIEYWNARGEASWVPAQERVDATFGPIGLAMLDAAGLEPGHRVLDVGCGCGATTLQAADRVGSDGHVTGVDVSAPMLARARARAGDRTGVVFVNADAQTTDLAGLRVDRIVSRFGVMFFDDPVAAFTNLGTALVRGGRLAFVCWQARERNPWMGLAVTAAADLVELTPPDPDGPGPFAFADRIHVGAIMAAAGFDDVAVRPLTGRLDLTGGASIDEAVEHQIQISPLAGLVGDDVALMGRVRERVRAALLDVWTDDGVVMDYASWIVTARRPVR